MGGVDGPENRDQGGAIVDDSCEYKTRYVKLVVVERLSVPIAAEGNTINPVRIAAQMSNGRRNLLPSGLRLRELVRSLVGPDERGREK
jgi:hypothetical protein